jgi:hypothetical protein
MSNGSKAVNITIDKNTKLGGHGAIHHLKNDNSNDDFYICIIDNVAENEQWSKKKTMTLQWVTDRGGFYTPPQKPFYWVKLKKDLTWVKSSLIEGGSSDVISFLQEYQGTTYLYFAQITPLMKAPDWNDIKYNNAKNPYRSKDSTDPKTSPYENKLDEVASKSGVKIKGWLLSSFKWNHQQQEFTYHNEIFVPLYVEEDLLSAGTPVLSWLNDKLCLTSGYAVQGVPKGSPGGSLHYFFDPLTLDLVDPKLVFLGHDTDYLGGIYLPKGYAIIDLWHQTIDHFPMGQLLVPNQSRGYILGSPRYFFIGGNNNDRLRVLALNDFWNQVGYQDLIPGYYPQGAYYDPDEKMYYVAYLDNTSQVIVKYNFAFQNIRLAIFDSSWNISMDLPVTNYSCPNIGLSGYFARGPQVMKNGDDVFVSYYILEAKYDPGGRNDPPSYHEHVETSSVYVRNMKDEIASWKHQKHKNPFLGVMPKTVLIPPELQSIAHVPESDVDLTIGVTLRASTGPAAGEQQVIHRGLEPVLVLAAESEGSAPIHLGGPSRVTTPTPDLSNAVRAEPTVEAQAGAVKVLSGHGILED